MCNIPNCTVDNRLCVDKRKIERENKMYYIHKFHCIFLNKHLALGSVEKSQQQNVNQMSKNKILLSDNRI